MAARLERTRSRGGLGGGVASHDPADLGLVRFEPFQARIHSS
jgi:hypothetical protein